MKFQPLPAPKDETAAIARSDGSGSNHENLISRSDSISRISQEKLETIHARWQRCYHEKLNPRSNGGGTCNENREQTAPKYNSHRKCDGCGSIEKIQ